MLENQACAYEGVERRRRAKVDATDNEHDRKVEEQGTCWDLLLRINPA